MAQLLEIPILGGVDERDEEHLSARPIELRNGRYRKRNSIAKRWGMCDAIVSATPDVGTLKPAALLTQSGDELIAVGSGDVRAVLDRAYQPTFVYRDRFTPCSVERTNAIQESDVVESWDMAPATILGRSAHMVVHNLVSVDTGFTVKCRVVVRSFDVETGGPVGDVLEVLAPTTDEIVNVRIVKFDSGTIAVFWFNVTTTTLFARYYELSTKTWGSYVSISAPESPYDVCAVGDVVHVVSTRSDSLSMVAYNVLGYTGSSIHSSYQLETVMPTAVSVRHTSGEPVWIGWASTEIYAHYAARNPYDFSIIVTSDLNPYDSTGGLGPYDTVRTISSVRIDSSTEMFIWGTNYGLIEWQKVNTVGSQAWPGTPHAWHHVATSKPWVRDDGGVARVYLATQCPRILGGAANTTSAFVSELIHDLETTNESTPQTIAHIAPVQVAPSTFRYGIDTHWYRCSSVDSDSDGATFLVPIALGRIGHVALDRVRVSYNAEPCASALGRGIVITGGVPSSYAGRGVNEVCPFYAPSITSIDDGTPSGTPLARTYQFRATYFWRDADGRVHESEPSLAVTLERTTDTYSRNPDVYVATIGSTNLGTVTPLGIAIYRTRANGAEFFRTGWKGDWQARQSSAREFACEPIRVSLDDSNLDGAPLLYTEGGVLANTCPPNATVSLFHDNRLWLAGTEDDRIWLSRRMVPDEGPSFHPLLTIDPFEGGRVRAMGSLTDKVILFKEDSCFFLFGEGPDDRGVGSTLSDPELLSSDVGCTNPRSVATTSLGLFFQSTNGAPYLVTPTLQVVPIGKDVEDAIAGLTVADAVLCQDAQELHVYLRDSNIRLVLDLLHSAPDAPVWSVDTLPTEASAGCVHRGVSTFVSNDTTPRVLKEDKTTNLDCAYGETSGAYPSLFFKSGWIAPVGRQGWYRVKELGLMLRRDGEHQCEVTVARDYDESTAYAFQFSSFEMGFDLGPSRLYSVTPPVQKCTAVQVTYDDTQAGYYSDGSGSVLEGLTLLVEPMDRMARRAKEMVK